ncbi:inner membrane protein YdgK [Escherichia coli]|nr:inner membrane protein YdgK [Escherichia coli]
MTTTTPQRIGGWLLGPLAWLLVALLSTTLALLLYTAALSSPQTFQTLGGQALTTQIFMGRFFYYRYRLVVLHTVVDHRFL